MCIVAATATALALASGAAADPISISPDAGYVTRTLNFGNDRGKKTIHFYFTASSSLSATPNATVRGLATSDGSQFDGTITAQAVRADGNKTIDVTVSVDPEKTKAGDYTGDLLLRGNNVTDARAELTVKLHPLPWPGAKEVWAWTLAFGLLVVGALIGWFVQWLAGPGTKLRDLVNRYEIVSALGGTLTSVPPGYRTALLEAGSQLAYRELDAAEASIKALEEKTPVVAKIDALARGLQDLFANQRATIEQMGLSGGEKDRLLRLVAVEESVKDDLLTDGWPDATAALTAAKDKLPHLRTVSSFLVLYPLHGQTAEFKKAVRQYLAGDYAAAETTWQSVPSAHEQADAAAQSVAAVELGEMAQRGAFDVPERRRLDRGLSFSPSLWAARHAPFFTGLLVVVGLGVAGLYTVFDPNETFRTNAGPDAVTLFVWGLAAGLGGVTASQLTGKLTPPSNL